jgi:DNA-binding XRE family transcriptional regulator
MILIGLSSHNRFMDANSQLGRAMVNRRSLEDMTPAQCRMARAALKLGVRELAQTAEVSTNTITRFENEEPLRSRTINAIKGALEQYGVIFTDGDANGGPGVRLETWYSAIFREVSKKGLTPPRLIGIFDQTIRLESTYNHGKIVIDIDRKPFDESTGLLLNNRTLEQIIRANMSSFSAFIAKLYLDNPLGFESIGDSKKHIAIGEEQLRDMAIRIRMYSDDGTYRES